MPCRVKTFSTQTFNLAVNLYPDDESISSEIIERISEVWREAIELGKSSGTTDGTEVAKKAEDYLAELLESRK